MLKKLTRHGNSLALVIDKPILQLLNIDENSKLEVVTDGVRLMVIPPVKASHLAKVESLIKPSHSKYAKVYRALSKPERGDPENSKTPKDESGKNEVSVSKETKREQLEKWLEKEDKLNSKVYKALSKPS